MGLISYGLSARLLGELLPLGRTLHATTVRRHTYRVGQRLDDELGPEQPVLHRGLPGRLGGTAPPGPAADRQPGRRLRALGPATVPPRRLVRGHRRQERARRRAGQMLRVRPDLRHQAQAAPLRAARRPGHAGQPAGHLPHRRRRRRARPAALPEPAGRAPAGLVPRHDAPHRADPARQGPARTPPAASADSVVAQLARLKWFCWHGNVFRALQTVEDLEFDLDVDDAGPEQRKLCKAVGEFGGYLQAVPEKLHPPVAERPEGGVVPFPSLNLPVVEFPRPSASLEAAERPLMDRGAQIMVVGEAARHNKVAFPGLEQREQLGGGQPDAWR